MQGFKPYAFVAGWSLFAGSHFVLSHPKNRDYVIKEYFDGSELNFQTAYSLFAMTTFIPTCVYYMNYSRFLKPRLFIPNKPMRITARILQVSSAFMFSQALYADIPTISKNENEEKWEPKGILRITRHPLFGSFALLGIGNVLNSGYLGPTIFWGAFPIFWYFGSMHQDMRKKNDLPANYFSETSILPFKAIIEGKQSLWEALEEMEWSAGLGSATAMATLIATRPKSYSRFECSGCFFF
ncbi:hypothetical protein O9G_004549 [Rozella allomycis CSF55]|uniref:NnrU domain-containing protein n=1 Tax=Rozella allomycis (strain CSF55) TaxID=988480 RepID=A0A075ANP7_ROZAC|nr:hypothetical protein O9G_004549 [Rozella allomycis CSF55]|eukprot:EPZ31517.1 hypothetical protein O9G_004549 [Rozella allomycis CSF55]